MNESVPPRVKFLPKASPVDCALLLLARTRHFLIVLLWRAPARKEEALCLYERARPRVQREEISLQGNAHRFQSQSHQTGLIKLVSWHASNRVKKYTDK